MWIVLVLSLLGRLSDAVIVPIPPHPHIVPQVPMFNSHTSGLHTHRVVPVSPLATGLATGGSLLTGGLRSGGGLLSGGLPSGGGLLSSGLISGIFDRLLGGDIHERLQEERVDGLLADRQGAEHGHNRDGCQHHNLGCDAPGFHCVQTSERGTYSICMDGMAAHCHCKRGCAYKGVFIQHGFRRAFQSDCERCACVAGEVRCRPMRRGRRCRRLWRQRNIDLL
ncbi:uncharacterized protein [Argopecten irradians]|uniref:uncharacterized protein n=1 Tax=Argopecten irradians TaxID=31199 RepID=UPI00371A1849